MLKTLIKKQLLEMVSFIYHNKRNGKHRSKASLIFYILIFIYVFGVFGVMFYGLFDTMCNMYFDAGLGWLYFTFAGIIATGLGVIGSVFTTYSSIYAAKDNEHLISMPILPSKILTARISGCYVMTFVFEMLVLIPCYIVYFMNRSFEALNLFFAIINLFLMPLFALSISCILGWIIALIAAKLPKNVKTVVTLLVSVAFLCVYFYLVSGANDVMAKLIENPEKIAGVAQYAFYPIFEFGHGSIGEISSFLISAGIIILLFAIIHAILSKTFLSLTTANKGSNLKKFTKKELGSSTIDSSLLKREFLRLKSSPSYILNCCMGTLFMIIAAVFLFIKQDVFDEMINMIGTEYAGLICSVALAFMAATNDLTAPSISLEGKSIWIAQSCPVSPWKVLKSKIRVHMILTSVPSLILAIIADIVIDMSIVSKIMLLTIAIIIPFFEAVFGLALNLKMPNLKWTNETVAVKQGANIFIALFGSWVVVILLAVLYFLLSHIINPDVYLILSVILVSIVSFVIYIWIKKRGTKIFSYL